MPVAAKVSTSGGGRERGGDAADLDACTGLPRGDQDDAGYAAFDQAAAVAAVAAGKKPATRREPGHGRSPHAAAGNPTGAGPRIRVQAVALRRRQAGRRGHRGARALATSQTVPDAAPGTVPASPAPTGRAARGATGPTAKRGTAATT